MSFKQPNVATYDAATHAFEGYIAHRHPDNTFTIKGLPIFGGDIDAGANHNTRRVDAAWRKQAFDYMRSLHESGFAGPAHVRHHEEWNALGEAQDEKTRVGTVVFNELKVIPVAGKPEETFIADVTDISAATFERIQKGELPHVSAEYVEVDQPRIDSVCFTGSRRPFKAYPNIKISRVIDAPKPARFTVAKNPAPTGAVIYMIQGGSMPDDEKKDNDKKDNDKKGPPDAATKEGDAKPEGEAMPGWAAQFAALIISGISNALGKGGTQAQGPASIPSVPPTVMAATKAEPRDGKVELTIEEFAAIKAAATEAVTFTRKAQADETKRVSIAKFEADLTKGGWTVDDDMRASMGELHEKGGEPAIALYVADVKKRVPKRMAGSAADFRASTTVAADSPAVMTYVQHGPVKLEKARKHAARYEVLRDAGIVKTTLEKFIENQFATEEANLRAANLANGGK